MGPLVNRAKTFALRRSISTAPSGVHEATGDATLSFIRNPPPIFASSRAPQFYRHVLLRLFVIGTLLCSSCGLSPFDAPQPRIEVKPDGSFTGAQMKPADVEHLLAKQDTGVRPILFPAYLTEGMSTCVANGNRDFFSVSCFGGALILSLQTQVEDPNSYKPKVLRRMAFRTDRAAQFMNANPADMGAVKLVLWKEPGHSTDGACACVHYDLHAVGISEVEFWKIANSLATL